MKFNLQALKQALFKQGGHLIVSGINRRHQAIFNKYKNVFLQTVGSHPIAIELANHTNPSAYLGGSSGSLFGFIGFPANYNPIEELLFFLENSIKFIPAKTISSAGITSFQYSIPSKEDFIASFPLFWERGRSWVYGIEEGIDGLGFFISNTYGRSQEGVQIKTQIPKKPQFKETPFLTPLFKILEAQMRQRGGVLV